MADKEFIDNFLEAHNNYRKLHQVPTVTISSKLNKFAQHWADHLAAKDTFAHSDCKCEGDRLGENIAMKSASSAQNYKAQEFVDQWYSEIERYDFKKNGGPSTGHFTQVVWKESKEIGVGCAKLNNGKKWIVVGSYFPAGNMMGQQEKNVFPTKDGKFTLPEKSGPKKGSAELKPCSGHGRPVSPGRKGGPSLSQPPPKGIPPGYTSVSRETTTKKSPCGKVETCVRETYNYPDGSKKTMEKKEIKSDGTPGRIAPKDEDLTKRMNDMKICGNRPGSGTGKAVSNNAQFIDDAVRAHNKHRSTHGVAPIKHNKKLSEIAQGWADHLAKSGKFCHSQNKFQGKQLGENIASKMSTKDPDYTGEAVVEQWYSEEKEYNYDDPECGRLKSGHFSQVVWKGSEEVGLGKAMAGNRCYVVANYFPAGNVMTHFKENVNRPH